MDIATLSTMTSVLIGFLFFGSAFASYMYKKSPKVTWSLFSVAVLLITVIPVFLAVFVAATPL